MMRDGVLRRLSMLNKMGVTLIELLVVLVISGIVIGGVYRVFISQTKAYTVQDRVAEIQQDVRGAMEIMLRDIRMAGFQTRGFGSGTIDGSPFVTPLNSNSITVNYEYITPGTDVGKLYTITYTLALQADGSSSLTRRLDVDGVIGAAELLLDNVTTLNFAYGIDENGDKVIDGIDGATGVIPDSAFKTAAYVNGSPTAKVFAVQIKLTAKPVSPDPDVTKVVSPRTLTSVVTPRNMYLKRFRDY
jgi:prepilin-type N-terminal cleavage/methylation domain-containing protein